MDSRITINKKFSCGRYKGQMYPDCVENDDSLTPMDKLIVRACIGELEEFQKVTDANQMIKDVLDGKAKIVLDVIHYKGGRHKFTDGIFNVE